MSYKRNIMENKCENCRFAKDYSGWDEHYCEARHCAKRAEEYDCKDFKPGIYVMIVKDILNYGRKITNV